MNTPFMSLSFTSSNQTTTKQSAHPYQKHDHRKFIDEHFALCQEYADDNSAITTDKNKIDDIKKVVHSELETRNLCVNKTKTEEYEIKRNRNESWKEYKLLYKGHFTKKFISSSINQKLKIYLLQSKTFNRNKNSQRK